METVSLTEVRELKDEINRLQQEIAELKKIHGENTYSRLYLSSCPSMEDHYVPNVSKNKELPFTSTALKQMLAVNDDLNGITYSAVQKTKVTSNVDKLVAECKCYNVLFNLACDLLTEPDGSITVMALKVTFEDASLVNEIMHFINSCHREKNLQSLLSGVARYAALSNVRQTVVRWLCNERSSTIDVNYSVDNGTYVIEVCGKGSRERYLTCNWSIHWQKRRCMLKPFLEISVSQEVFPPERWEVLQRMCEKPPCDIKGMKEAWEEIIDFIAKME